MRRKAPAICGGIRMQSDEGVDN